MKSRGVITFVFDDGYECVYKHVVPTLNSHRMPAVFAIPLDGSVLQQQTGMIIRPWQDWQDIGSQHEIAAHGVYHRAMSELAPDALTLELKRPADILKAKTLVYPGGSRSDEVIKLARHWYTAARTVKHGFETLPPKNPMELKTYNFNKNNFSLWKVNLLAGWACLTNTWLIETYHVVDTKEHGLPYSLPLDAFAKHLDFVARLPVAVKTIRNVVT